MREPRTKRLNLRVSEEWYDRVDEAARSYGLSMTDVIMFATRYFLELERPPDITFTRTRRSRKEERKKR